MWWPVPAELVEPWTRTMGRASVYGGLTIAAAWLLCRSLPRMSPSVRSWIWRLVYLKLILLWVWPSAISLPLLPSPAVYLERAQAGPPNQKIPTASRTPMMQEWQTMPHESGRAAAQFSSVMLFVIWLGGVFFVAIRTVRNIIATRKTLRECRPLTAPQPCQECEALSHYMRLKRSPALLSHDTVSSPQGVGLMRPVLLFPTSFVDHFSTQEIRLVLAHELAHLQRHDLAWGCLRRLVNGLLFFHPLVWIAHEQATLAEEIACDEAALGVVNATVSDYAGTLLRVTERGLLSPQGATVLLGTGMSRAYRVIAHRLEALQQIRILYSRIARRRRRQATLLACLPLAVLLPLGLMTWFHNSGIRQIDPRYQVLGFTVSRGRSHTLSVKREICRIAGFKLSRVVEDTEKPQPFAPGGSGTRSSATWNTNPNAPGSSVPMRVAGWLRKIGLKPQLETGGYSCGVYLADESCAVIVRFAHDPKYGGYEDIVASLVDEQGETIALAPHRSEVPAQSGEYVKFWVVSPAPVTRAQFNLRLRLATEGKDVAILRLGAL